MNAATIIVFGIAWLVFAYFWYGRIIQKKLVKPSDKKPTPAVKINDGQDYVPTKPPLLFGHHFASIAGAGPIVGPILAFALFGWLPAIIWILLGSVFMGAVHDYTALMISIRHKGISIVEIAEKVVSRRAMEIFGAFVWLTMTLLQAVFADLTAKTLVEKPEIALPTFGIIGIAVLFGLIITKKRGNTILFTVIALLLLLVFIILGNNLPISLGYHAWLIIVFLYTFAASILPVWILLQPRDYLSMYILLIGLATGVVGILITRPEINAPALISFNSSQGPLFPILFITIACGAISGFHSLVASGTTAKQLDKESHGKEIAFGGMLTEGLLALLVIVMISSVLIWNPDGSVSGVLYGFHNLLKESANIVFGTALGRTISSIGIPLSIGIAFGILMLNSFLLTSLDTSARLNRYVIQETLGSKLGGIFKNKYFASSASLILAYILCLSGGYKMIWPAFGASNQLIATIALFVVTAYFLSQKLPKWYTLLPAIIMLIVTETALFYQTFWQYIPHQNWILAGISAILFILGISVTFEVYSKVVGFRLFTTSPRIETRKK